jgi:hypothetical protein
MERILEVKNGRLLFQTQKIPINQVCEHGKQLKHKDGIRKKVDNETFLNDLNLQTIGLAESQYILFDLFFIKHDNLLVCDVSPLHVENIK